MSFSGSGRRHCRQDQPYRHHGHWWGRQLLLFPLHLLPQLWPEAEIQTDAEGEEEQDEAGDTNQGDEEVVIKEYDEVPEENVGAEEGIDDGLLAAWFIAWWWHNNVTPLSLQTTDALTHQEAFFWLKVKYSIFVS